MLSAMDTPATPPLSPEELERYARHIVLPEVGGPGQQKLKRARGSSPPRAAPPRRSAAKADGDRRVDDELDKLKKKMGKK